MTNWWSVAALGLSLISLASALTINTTDCHVENSGDDHGKILLCKENYYAVEACNSGGEADCVNGDRTYLKCCKEITTEQQRHKIRAKACAVSGGDHGTSMQCDGQSLVTGICGSGSRADCKLGDDDFHAMVRCCDDHTMLRTELCFWEWRGHGQVAVCPDTTVAAGFCGSGSNEDCNGETASFGLYCCAVE